jgi:hypothetical protein
MPEYAQRFAENRIEGWSKPWQGTNTQGRYSNA